ncbi:MAG: hypothetical protein II336_08615 [Loktanella sp.]|nr:hypothetical protein [Loktanella sp.]
MPYDDSTRQTPPIYLVMESNLLIAEDICGALQAYGACQVIRITHPDELTQMVDSEQPITAAFLEMRYDQVLHMGLTESFLLRGARIVLTVGEGDEVAVQDHGWAMLVRPFTEEMIHAALQSSVREA